MSVQSQVGSFTIKEWCQHRRISVAYFYELDKINKAPESHYVGSKRLISGEADVAWVRAREAETRAAREQARAA